MAREFTPDLGQISPGQVPSGGTSGINFGSLGAALQNRSSGSSGSDLAERRFQYQVAQDKQETREEGIYSDALGQVLNERVKVNNLTEMGQDVDRMRDFIKNSAGNIPASEQRYAENFYRKYEAYTLAMQQGTGNEAAYNTRIMGILSEANAKAPGIAKDLYSIATGALSDFDEVTQPTKDQLAFQQQMTAEFGPNFTLENVNQKKDQLQKIANWDERAKSGQYSATVVELQVPNVVGTLTAGTLVEAERIYRENSQIPEETVTQLTDALRASGEKAKAAMREAVIANITRTNGFFSTEQLDSINKKVDDQIQRQIEMFDGKDTLSKLQQATEINKLSFELDYGDLQRKSDIISKVMGPSGVNGLVVLLSDPSKQAAIKAYVGEEAFNAMGEPAAVMTELYSMMGQTMTDKPRNTVKGVLSTAVGVLNDQPLPEAAGAVTEGLDISTKDPDGIIIPGNVKSAASSLMMMSGRQKRNYYEALKDSPTNAAKFSTMTKRWLELANAEDQWDIGGYDEVRYNGRTGRFESVKAPATRQPTGDLGVLGVSVGRDPFVQNTYQNTRARLLNTLLDIANDPWYQPNFMKPEQVVKFVNASTVATKAAKEDPAEE